MRIYRQRLLTDVQLRRLGEHKYSCTSNSFCDALLQPWWNWLVGKLPIWLAPNLITVVGLLVNVATTLILVGYSADAKKEAPGWACFLCGVGLFVYQSLDAIDGKQARRTGNSNPLGELFDHGCDSISTVFVALSACIAVQLGNYPAWMFFQCFCAMTLFYCAHWQTYVSGTLRFGKVDVTEAQYTIIAIHLISALFGPSVWSTKFFGDTVSLWYGIPLCTFLCGANALYSMLGVIFTGGVGKNGSSVAVAEFWPIGELTGSRVICCVFYTGYAQLFCNLFGTLRKGGCGKNGSTVALFGTGIELKAIPIVIAVSVAASLAYRTLVVILRGGAGKNGSTVAGTSVLSPIIPFCTVIVPAFIIYVKSQDEVYEKHPVLYILAFGLVAAKVTNKLVVAHMTKSEMEYVDISLIGPSMLFFNQYFNYFIPEYYVLWLCMVFVTVDLYIYCRKICAEICAHLHVELFRIPYSGHQGGYHSSRSHTTTIVGAAGHVTTASASSSSDKNGLDTKLEDKVPLLLDLDDI